MNFRKIAQKYLNVYEVAKTRLDALYSRKRIRRYLGKEKPLTAEQCEQVRAFYAPYKKIKPLYHQFYMAKSGRFDPRFLPADLYYTKLDPYFNPGNLSRTLDNKCLYPRLFPGIPQADNILFRMGGFWFDATWNMITMADVLKTVEKEPAVVMKAATNSVCGTGVRFIEGDQESIGILFAKACAGFQGDLVVQRPLRQHESFSALHSSSINTLRLVTLLTEDGPKVYSAVVRMGSGGERIDNAVVTGLFCSVKKDGSLGTVGYRLNGDQFPSHPTSGLVFSGHRLAGTSKAWELVEKAAKLLPSCRFIAWDVVVNSEGEPLLLECNLAKGDIHYHQLTNGPIFGEDTKKVLDEVFGKK